MAGQATFQEAVLRAIGPQACLTTQEIAAATEADGRRVATSTGALVVQGLVERVERGCFQLTDDGRELLASGRPLTSGPRGGRRAGPNRPRRDTLRQRAWTAMRMRRFFTLSDLLLLASRPENRDAASNLRRWVTALREAGFVTVARQVGNEHVYRLARNTGPIAPCLRAAAVHDLNTGVATPLGGEASA